MILKRMLTYKYKQQVSVGDLRYTIILFINITFLPTVLNYLNDREKERQYFLLDFGAPPPPQYLTILMTERGGVIILCRILAPPNAPPPSPDATIPNDLNDRERRRAIIL